MDTSKMIFVFGSNTGGIHGAGAARYAMDKRGAKPGIGIGRTGECYAIPTKGHERGPKGRVMIGETLSLERIRVYVDEFLAYADKHPELQFQVTCIGCGLAGLRHENIAPMFNLAPLNCYFDKLWYDFMSRPMKQFWGSF